MPTRRVIPFSDGVYFITFTCCRWMPLIEVTLGYDIIYNWFEVIINDGHYILGFVIMPNHVHVLIGFKNSGIQLNKIIGNGKRFMAYEIVKRLVDLRESGYLKVLAEIAYSLDRAGGRGYRVWEKSFNWKLCISDKFLLQKLNYIHENPCSGKWMLSRSPIEYCHSSAGFYETGLQGVFPVTNYMLLKDIDLSNPAIQSSPSASRDGDGEK